MEQDCIATLFRRLEVTMGFFSGCYSQVPDAATAKARVEAGAAYLDRKVGTEWDQFIDTTILDVASPLRCVLAQLGLAGHICIQTPATDVRCGFSCGVFPDVLCLLFLRTNHMVGWYELLNDAWRTLIDKRRAQRKQTTNKESAPRIQPAERVRVGSYSADHRTNDVETAIGNSA